MPNNWHIFAYHFNSMKYCTVPENRFFELKNYCELRILNRRIRNNYVKEGQ